MGEVHLSHHLDARRRERRTPLPRLRPPSRPSGCVSPMVWVHPRCLPGARLRCSTCTRNASRPHLAGGGARAARVQVHLSWMRDAPVSCSTCTQEGSATPFSCFSSTPSRERAPPLRHLAA